MFLRTVSASLVSCVLLFAPLAGLAQDKRGPSTPEERQQALVNIHSWQSDPLGPQAKDQFGSVLKWLAEVPDLTVHVCSILDSLPKGDKKHASTIFGGEVMAQAAFLIENPTREMTDRLNLSPASKARYVFTSFCSRPIQRIGSHTSMT